MRALLWLAMALAGGGVADAKTFHESVACLQCHSGSGTIRPTDEVRLCLRCHGRATGAPDVLYRATVAASLALAGAGGRSGGGLSLAGDGAGGQGWPGEMTGHTIGSTRPPPGFGGTWPGGPLTCRSCHAFHPNGNYRNLGPDPLLSDPAYVALAARLFPPEAQPSFAEVPEGTHPRDVDADVLVVQGRPPYDADSVIFSTNGGRNAMNAFCAACHSEFHGEGNTRAVVLGGLVPPPDYVRHPTSGIPIEGDTLSALARSRSPPRLNWREDGVPEVACLTCHRAHGTIHPSGLVYWDPAADVNGESGAAPAVEPLCSACHVIGAPELPVARSTGLRPPLTLPVR